MTMERFAPIKAVINAESGVQVEVRNMVDDG